MSTSNEAHVANSHIAIVGMAGRFPGAASVDALWQLMIEGRDAIAPIPVERWDTSEQLDPEKSIQAVGGFLDGVDQFDPTFFGISPREAEEIDPQHRLILEASYRALEDAGVAPATLHGSRTGVYVGASWHDYEILRKERGAAVTQHTAVGNALDMAAARVSYFYKLKGPSLTLETGCSSSLVALHIACRALLSGEIEGAIVGGVNLILAPDVSVGLTHFGGLSPDGRCKAFSASANGFVRGEGVVTLYVKTLEKALSDGDRIHALIARTEVNNDGGGDSLVTPFPLGQTDLLQRAYGQAQVPLDALAYVEAHGTGTSRGDPIEAGAIGRTLGVPRSAAAGPLAVGSLKTNIGHLEAVAGLAGLVKAVLSLEHRLVPRTLHAEELNPNIPFADLNLSVVREPLALPSQGDVYVGVNSFGWGGTNAHVVLKSAPAVLARAPVSADTTLIAVSAHHQDTLRQCAGELADALLCSDADLCSLGGTLAHGRAHFAERAAIVTDSKDALARTLLEFAKAPDSLPAEVVTGTARARGKVAFVFPGQGSQWAEMGKQLYASSARFHEVIVRCAQALQSHVSWDLTRFVSGEAGNGWLEAIDTLQPTLWAMSVGLAELWRDAGIEPDLVIGHSMGEVAAATVAGMLSYEDAARVIARRSAIAQGKAGRGQMLAVDLGLTAARAALAGFEDRVSLAVNNGPSSCVLSGDTDAIGVLKEILEGEGTFCRLVRVDFASHSQQMDEFKDELFAALTGITPQAGKTAMLSTVLTREVAGTELDAAYWVKNLREPVLFADAVSHAVQSGVTHLIEVSPHPVLTPALEQLAELQAEAPSVLSTLRRDEGSVRHMTLALARAYVSGLAPFAQLPRDARVKLPGYPLSKRSFWVAPSKRKNAARSGLDFELAPTAVEQDSWEGSLELDLDALPWLRDHKVHEAVVLPAAGMMALALSTAVARLGGLPGALSKVSFSEKLTLSDDPRRVSVLFRDDVAQGGSFQLLSLAGDASTGASKWSQHAAARVGPAVERAGRPFPAHMLAQPEQSVESFYDTCVARGLLYGPAFQGLRKLYVSGGQALGEVVLPELCRTSARPLGLHPALWDGALQVSLALQTSAAAVVPTEVARVDLLAAFEAPVHRLWSHVERIDDTHFDLTFYDEQQQPLLHMSGLALLELAVGSAAASLDERVHQLVFREAECAPQHQTLERWLVYGHADDGAEALSAALAARGVSAARSEPGSASSASWSEQLRKSDAQAVAFLVPRLADVAEHRATLLMLSSLASACARLPTPARVVVITAHAQPILQDEPIVAEGALYWGFTRVLRREHAELSPLVLDLGLLALDWSACVSELLCNDGEDQVALRGARRFVGRLTRGELPEAHTRVRSPWRNPAQPFRLVTARAGLWDALEYRPLVRQPVGPGDVEIEVDAAALNFIDVMKAMGTYPGVEGRAAQLGGECAGRVVALGADVKDLQLGDRVAGCAFGAFASHVTLCADHVRRVPEHLTNEQAAALPLVMMTAWYGLHDLGRLAAGETVLIHSATGGLGLAALQVAQHLGAKVIATAGSQEKRDLLRGLGVEHVFDSRSLAWADDVLRVTENEGVDVVLNSLTGAAIGLGMQVLAEDGRFIEVGKKDIYEGRKLSLDPFRKSVSFAAVDLAGLMERRPARFARLFSDVWAALKAGQLRALPVLPFAFAEASDALRTMGRGAHVGKFVLVRPESVQAVAAEPLVDGRFRHDASYLLSGGLGALGLELVEFMAERGARAFLLLGRSAPSEQAKQRLAALALRGVQVVTAAVDVADRAALSQVLDEARKTLPALRGVIHAAGLLDDATIEHITEGQLQRVLAPKVEGASNLDALTDADALDMFVMFSSAAALIGNAGQAAYAAANAYLDALAEARRRRGRPALSMQWGPFAEIGLAAQDQNRGARLSERGMGSFTAAEGFLAMLGFLGGGDTVVGYVPLELRQWFDAYPETAGQKSWQVLRDETREGSANGKNHGFVAELSGLGDKDRQTLAEAKVRELAGRVLRLDPISITSDVPFKALGLDSLMSLELRNRLESVFGLRLSPTLLWTYGNARALAAVLCDRVAAAA